MASLSPPPESVLEYLEKVLASEAFRNAGRSSRLLRFVVEQTLKGNQDSLKEYTLGTEVLGRNTSFDPRIDPIARVEVSRLRSRLDQYYATEGRSDSLILVMPKGSYVPLFETPPEPSRATGNRIEEVRPPIWWFLAGLAVAGFVVFCVRTVYQKTPSVERKLIQVEHKLIQLEVELRSTGQLGSVVGTDFTISPDGSHLAFVSSDADGVARIFTRRLNERQASPLPGSEGGRGPFFSPDGQWLSFWAGGKLLKAAVLGGSAIVLCDAPDLLGGSWGDDGNIIAVLNSTSKLWRIPSAGGVPVAVVDLPQDASRQAWPQVLPGAKAVLFTAMPTGSPDSGRLEVFSFRDKVRKTLLKGGTFARYLPSGEIVYVNQGTLYAATFDPEQLRITGAPTPVLQNVEYSPVFGFAQFAFSDTGVFMYRRSAARGQSTIQWLTSSGSTSPLLSKSGSYLWPRLSPDGKLLAFCRTESAANGIWSLDTKTNTLTQITSGATMQSSPLWSPDGRLIVFQEDQDLKWMPSGGSGVAQTLVRTSGVKIPWSFSPDGTRLAYYEMNAGTHFDLWTVPVQFTRGTVLAGKPEPFLKTNAIETYPSFSPDGRWIAYASNQSGSFEVYVRAFPDNGTEVRISRGGGRVPHWDPKAGNLFYDTDDHRLMVTAYHVTQGRLQPELPRQWTRTRLADNGVLANYDIASGGRVAALLPAGELQDQQSQNHVTFLLNFFDEVARRRMATRPPN
jgi:Tol biopolymer transport system component